MAWLLQPLDDRLVAILELARGADGTLGAPEVLRAITAQSFRRSADRMPLDDPGYPGDRFDCAYEVRYDALDDHTPGSAPVNPLDAVVLYDVRVTLRIGHVAGVAHAGLVAPRPATTEVPADSVVDARMRALSTAAWAVRALTYPGLFRDTTTDPVLVDCRRDGATTIDVVGGGRLVSETPLMVWLQVTNATVYAP